MDDLSDIFLDGTFDSSVTYKGGPIRAVIERNWDQGQKSQAGSNRRMARNSAAVALFTLAAKDCLDLKKGDKFTEEDGTEWSMYDKLDASAGMIRVLCKDNKRQRLNV